MLCLVGTDVDPGRSFLCKEAAAGRSLGFRGGDKEGAFPHPPSGVRRTSPGTGASLGRNQLCAEWWPPGGAVAPRAGGSGQISAS